MPFGANEQSLGQASSITIEELGPSGPGLQPRKVVLLGPSLPFQGAEWAFENNLVTTWYPGNGDDGSQQNMGPRELPSSWEGKWSRTLMGKAPSTYSDETGTVNRVISPHLLREVIESIGRAGVRLRVTWAVIGAERVGQQTAGFTTSKNPDGTVRRDRVLNRSLRDTRFKIVREGRIKTFRTPFDRLSDVRWTIEFAWVGRGAAQSKVATVRENEDAAKATQAIVASVNATIAAATTKIFRAEPKIRKSATRFTLGQLENLAAAPTRLTTALTRKLQQNVSDFKRIGDIAAKFESQPLSVTNAVMNFARNTTSVANRFADQMGRRPAEQQSLKTKVSAVLRTTNYFAGVSNAAALNASRGQDLGAAVRRTLVSGANRGAVSVRASSTTRAGEILAIHVAKTGDTPQTVSLRYYGNADQGVAILRANRMPYHQPTFAPGVILVIPSLGSGRGVGS